jgi:manganese transport protein
MDPGNFATNIAGGSKFGFTLVWVIVASRPDGDADPDAVGEARDRNGPEPPGGLPRALLPPNSIGLWIQAELIAMATDLAEFLGAALLIGYCSTSSSSPRPSSQA